MSVKHNNVAGAALLRSTRQFAADGPGRLAIMADGLDIDWPAAISWVMTRPNFPHTFVKQLTLAPDLMARVSAYRFERHHRYEMDAIRRLIEVGLETEAKDAGPRIVRWETADAGLGDGSR